MDVSSKKGHVMLAVGPQNHPSQHLLSSGSALIFSTASESGDSVLLQAWSPELTPQWQRPDRILLRFRENLAGWDDDPFAALVRVN